MPPPGEIQLINESNSVSSVSSTSYNLNTKEGYANQVFCDIFQNSIDEFEVKETMAKWKTEGKTITNLINEGKRLTSVTVFAAGKTYLDGEIMELLEAREKKKEDEI